MTLFEVAFNFEYNPMSGDSSVLCESMKQVRTLVKDAFESYAHELIEGAEKYGTEKPEDKLTASLRKVEVVPITKASFCRIINTSGGAFVQNATELGEFSMRVGQKRIVFQPKQLDIHIRSC